MRGWKFFLALLVFAASVVAMTGCATTERDGVIIEQRRWWHIFSETEPSQETDEETYPS